MQRITILGRVGADAEIKDLGGNQVINFSVAVDESYKNAQGEKVDKTVWFECARWGNNTSIAQYIKKGDNIYIEGKVNNRAWIDQSGDAQVTNGINVFDIQLLGTKSENTNP